MKKRLLFLSVITLMFLWSEQSWGAMSSTNYYIYADAINVGGVLSTSSVYNLQDTSGELFAGSIVGGSYEIKGGYQAMEQGELSLLVNESSLSLGSLVNYTASSTASVVASVVNNSAGGFSLSIGTVSGTIFSDVVDGAVDGNGGSEEYGIGVTGIDAAFPNDRSVVLGRLLASSVVPSSSDTTLIFKAIRNASTTPGTYNQSITLIASANF